MSKRIHYQLTIITSSEKRPELSLKKRTIYDILNSCKNNGHRLTYGEHEPDIVLKRGKKTITTRINLTCKEELPEDIQTQLKQYCNLE